MGVVRGNAEIAALGRAMQAAAATELRKELLAGIRTAARPMVDAVRQAARDELPKAGGLNERVASSPIAVRTRLTGTSAGVRIVNTAKVEQGRRGGTVDFGTDTGRLRHPVFGHRDRWVTQPLSTSGWFSKTLDEKAPEAAPEVLAAMRRTAGKLMDAPGAMALRSLTRGV